MDLCRVVFSVARFSYIASSILALALLDLYIQAVNICGFCFACDHCATALQLRWFDVNLQARLLR